MTKTTSAKPLTAGQIVASRQTRERAISKLLRRAIGDGLMSSEAVEALLGLTGGSRLLASQAIGLLEGVGCVERQVTKRGHLRRTYVKILDKRPYRELTPRPNGKRAGGPGRPKGIKNKVATATKLISWKNVPTEIANIKVGELIWLVRWLVGIGAIGRKNK